MIGPGKYDQVLTHAREEAKAEGAILAVYNGKHGNGFAAQLSPRLVSNVPQVLREMADEIELDVAPPKPNPLIEVSERLRNHVANCAKCGLALMDAQMETTWPIKFCAVGHGILLEIFE